MRGRDRRLVVLAVLLSGSSRHAPPQSCATAIVVGFMGGETHTRCVSPP